VKERTKKGHRKRGRGSHHSANGRAKFSHQVIKRPVGKWSDSVDSKERYRRDKRTEPLISSSLTGRGREVIGAWRNGKFYLYLKLKFWGVKVHIFLSRVGHFSHLFEGSKVDDSRKGQIHRATMFHEKK